MTMAETHSSMRMMILGAGYSGTAIGREALGHGAWVGGTSRKDTRLDALRDHGIAPFRFDGSVVPDDLASALATTTHLIQSIAPAIDSGDGDDEGGGDPVLPLLGGSLRRMCPKLRWVGYLSTVGVYGDHDGAWVDEDTPCAPTSQRSIARLATEEAWAQAGAADGLPVALIRLSGIYGPGRNAFVNLTSGRAKRLIKPGQVFNRIHRDDIAGATFFLAQRELGGAWNVTDDLPAPPQDVVAYAADLMGVPPPPEIDFETAALTPMARSFYGENKRVANRRLHEAGYRFRFPDYRVALSSLWRDGAWQDER
jgi:hypothetical protein